MVSSFRRHWFLPQRCVRASALAAAALAIMALGATASTASAEKPVNIVRQGAAPGGQIPPNTHYFKTIQGAVEWGTRGRR